MIGGVGCADSIKICTYRCTCTMLEICMYMYTRCTPLSNVPPSHMTLLLPSFYPEVENILNDQMNQHVYVQ